MTRKKKNNRSLWIMLALIAALAVAIFLLPSCGSRASADESTLVAVGDQAPGFTAEALDGQPVTLADLRGRVVLLNFWATWCPPCRAELKRVPQDVVEHFAGRDFTLLAVSRGEERATVEEFRRQNGYEFPMYLDPDRHIYDLYATDYIPRNFLIGKDGRIVKITVGYTPAEFAELLQAIETELQK